MASENTALVTRPLTLSMGEVTALCQRLEARANSPLSAQDPQAASDTRLAAAVIRYMQASAFHHSDLVVLPNGVAAPALA